MFEARQGRFCPSPCAGPPALLRPGDFWNLCSLAENGPTQICLPLYPRPVFIMLAAQCQSMWLTARLGNLLAPRTAAEEA